MPLFAIGGLLGFLAIERRIPVTLPEPSGPFAVGRTIVDWKDEMVVDSLAPVPGVDPPHWIIRLLTRTKARVHSIPDADVSPERRSYPVLIMRGGASAGVLGYSTLAADLASHGYVVVGIDAPYRTGRVIFPDGRVIDRSDANNPELAFGSADSARLINKLMAAWTSDIGFALDRLQRLNLADSSRRFTGRLDLSRVGVFGHSLGGAQAAQFCSQDSRCTAGVDIDGAPVGSVIRD